MDIQDKLKVLSDLRMLLKLFKYDDDKVFESRSLGLYDGLCLLTMNRSITNVYVVENVPKGRETYSGYAWSQRSKRGRMEWLRKHIRKLQMETRHVQR